MAQLRIPRYIKLEALPKQYALPDIFMVIVYGRKRDSEHVAYVGREEQYI